MSQPLLTFVAPAEIVQALGKSALSVLEDVTIRADNNGLEVRKMNNTKIAMVHFLARKVSFRTYTCEEPVEFTVNAKYFLKLLSRAKDKGDAVALSFDGDLINLAIIRPPNEKRKYVLANTPPPLGIGAFDPPLAIRYNTIIKLASALLKRTITDLEIGGDTVTFACNNDALMLTTRGIIAQKAIAKIERDMEGVINFESPTEQEQDYNFDWIREIVKNCSDISDIVTIGFGIGMPLHISFEVTWGEIEFWLSSR